MSPVNPCLKIPNDQQVLKPKYLHTLTGGGGTTNVPKAYSEGEKKHTTKPSKQKEGDDENVSTPPWRETLSS